MLTETVTSPTLARQLLLERAPYGVPEALTRVGGLQAADVIGDDYFRLTGKRPITIAEHIDRMRDQMPLSRKVA